MICLFPGRSAYKRCNWMLVPVRTSEKELYQLEVDVGMLDTEKIYWTDVSSVSHWSEHKRLLSLLFKIPTWTSSWYNPLFYLRYNFGQLVWMDKNTLKYSRRVWEKTPYRKWPLWVRQSSYSSSEELPLPCCTPPCFRDASDYRHVLICP